MSVVNTLLSRTNAAGSSLLAQAGDTFWLPPPESNLAEAVDDLFYFILYVATFFFLLVVTLMVFFVIRYRRRPGHEPGPSRKHNTALEIFWTTVPLIIVIIIFYEGFVGYMDMRVPAAGAYEIKVKARRWSWAFEYDGYVDENLHVPVDRPVRLLMESEDVIHSLWVPAFRVKMDVVPGRYSTAWFIARRPGIYDLYCAEYCGTSHYDMGASVVVHEPGEFEKWLEDAESVMEGMSPAQRGEMFYRQYGCRGCHSIDGTAKTGPSFLGIFGETHRFTNASPVVVDENYLRESILNPSAKIREGYMDQMNSYQGQLTNEEIGDLIEFIKSRKKE